MKYHNNSGPPAGATTAEELWISVLPRSKYCSRQKIQGWERMLDTIIIYTVFFSELWHKQQGINRNFSTRGLPLGEYISKDAWRIVIYHILYANSIAATRCSKAKVPMDQLFTIGSRFQYVSHELIKADNKRRQRMMDASFTAFFSSLRHSSGGSPAIVIDFHGLERLWFHC